MPYKDEDVRRERSREYSKASYQRHKAEVIAKRKQRQIEIHNSFKRYKSTLCCMKCGISHPAVLQFHHRNKAGKSFAIANVVARATSMQQIINELKKCDVLCVNCHAKHHWREKYNTDNWEEALWKGKNP